MRPDSAELKRLAEGATVRAELKGPDVPSAARPLIEEQLAEYPGVDQLQDYMELLESTGGLHAHNKEFDLVLYGLTGFLVPSFREGWFMTDDRRHFLFGELLYPQAGSDEVFLFFDTTSGDDAVWARRDAESGELARAADSLADLFSRLAERRYPLYPEPSGT